MKHKSVWAAWLFAALVPAASMAGTVTVSHWGAPYHGVTTWHAGGPYVAPAPCCHGGAVAAGIVTGAVVGTAMAVASAPPPTTVIYETPVVRTYVQPTTVIYAPPTYYVVP